jgi:hypothetical protein
VQFIAGAQRIVKQRALIRLMEVEDIDTRPTQRCEREPELVADAGVGQYRVVTERPHGSFCVDHHLRCSCRIDSAQSAHTPPEHILTVDPR